MDKNGDSKQQIWSSVKDFLISQLAVNYKEVPDNEENACIKFIFPG